MSKRQGGILESWTKVNTVGDHYIIFGKVFGDPNWKSGNLLRTSTVEGMKGGKLYTRNTVYRLGNKSKVFNEAI
jgi:hypothetical protein